MQQEKLTKGIYFGYIGNLLFVAFGITSIFYYFTYENGSIFSKLLEGIAYGIEIFGFGILLYADWLFIKSLRLRRLLKFSFTAYILLEAVMMFLELNSYKIEDYKPFSMPVAMAHAAASGLVCFSFLQLDPDNVKWEFSIGACFTFIITGMMGCILGMRVYFSIMMSAIGFAALFWLMRFFRDREELEIDCYGDRATEKVFSSSTLFAEEKDEETENETEETQEKEEEINN